MVDLHRVIIGVIVREIGAGEDECVAGIGFALDELCQRNPQRATVLIALVAHHDGHDFKVAQHLLQPGQLHFNRVFAAC